MWNRRIWDTIFEEAFANLDGFLLLNCSPMATRPQNGHRTPKWPPDPPNGHQTHQMATRPTKWPPDPPNGHQIHQMATILTKWPRDPDLGEFLTLICHPWQVPTHPHPTPPKLKNVCFSTEIGPRPNMVQGKRKCWSRRPRERLRPTPTNFQNVWFMLNSLPIPYLVQWVQN